MVDSKTLTEVCSWSPADRLELIEEVWFSLDQECFVPPMTEELRFELTRRREAAKSHPEHSRPWNEVLASIRARSAS